MKNTSDRLKEIMLERDIKQIDLVKMTGIGKSAISQYLSGKVVPKQDKIYILSEALKVNPAWLMGHDVEKEEVENVMIYIKKEILAECELLPDVVDTPLWEKLDIDGRYKASKAERQLAGLYAAVAARENYFQQESPTAFGNPKYDYLSGVVQGYLMAMELIEEENGEEKKIYFRKNNRSKAVVLVVDKLQRPDFYYEAQKQIREILDKVGI